MGFTQNILKQERIARFGQTVDLPLFNQSEESLPMGKGKRDGLHQNLPDWIWNGKEMSQKALAKFEKHLAEKEIEYLNAVLSLGGSATDNEVAEFKDKKWQNGFISARRGALMKIGIIVSRKDAKDELVSKIGPCGVKNTIWFVNFKKLFMLTLD